MFCKDNSKKMKRYLWWNYPSERTELWKCVLSLSWEFLWSHIVLKIKVKINIAAVFKWMQNLARQSEEAMTIELI